MNNKIKSNEKRLGWYLIFGPIVCLVFVLLLHLILTFISLSIGNETIFPIPGLILSLLGIGCLLAIVPGIIAGIIILVKSKKK